MDYLSDVWDVMKLLWKGDSIMKGYFPGHWGLQRKAASYFIKAKGYKASLQSRGRVFAFALAVSEENASGGEIVTAPTCGSCGVVPAVHYHLEESRSFSKNKCSVHWLQRTGRQYRKGKCLYFPVPR
jgi:L-serine dehydratase